MTIAEEDSPPAITDLDADIALNCAAFGWVIGCEMTHGFDDAGRQYDKGRNLKNRGTKEEAANFKDQTILP